MKLMTQIIKDLKYVKESVMYFIVCFIVAPVIIGGLFGVMFLKMMDTKVEFKETKVMILAQEEGEQVEVVEELLRESNMGFIDIVEISNREELKEKGVNALFIDEENKNLVIENFGKDSMEKKVIRNIIDDFNGVIQEVDLKSESEREEFINSYLALMNKEYSKTLSMDVDNKLTSFQTMIINMFVAMNLFVGITFASQFIKDRENSVLKRLVSMKTTNKEMYLNNIISVFIISTFITYVYCNVVFGLVLKTGITPLNAIIPSLLYGGLIAGIFGISIGIFRREKVYKNSMTPIIMIMMMLGGSSFPLEMFDNVFILSKIMPNYIMQNILYDVALGKGISIVSEGTGVILIEIVLVLTIGAIKFRGDNRGKKNVKYSNGKFDENIKGC